MAVNACYVRSLFKGLFLSTGLSIFIHFGIMVVYSYLPLSSLLMPCLAVLCFIIFGINIRYERYLDVNEVFYKTIAVDFRSGNSLPRKFFIRYIRPLNPYVGFLGTIAGVLSVLWVVPALIIYYAVHPGPDGSLLNVCVFLLSVGAAALFFLSGKDGPHSFMDKLAFFTGTVIGSAGTIIALL